jgi:hypothetical protein
MAIRPAENKTGLGLKANKVMACFSAVVGIVKYFL